MPHFQQGRGNHHLQRNIVISEKKPKHFQNNRTVLEPQKCDSLLGICKTRSNELSLKLVAHETQIKNGQKQVHYHKACRAIFVHPLYIQTVENVSSEESEKMELPQKCTRSQNAQSVEHLIGKRTVLFVGKYAVIYIGVKLVPSRRVHR